MRVHALTFLATLALAGCGGGGAPLAPMDVARRALLTSLEAWKAGKPPRSLADQKPVIETIDFEWKAGKILSDFALGDEAPGEGVQVVSATLTIKGEPRPKVAKYMILGLDPVRIFRDEDYNRAMNMDNAPTPTEKIRR